MMLSFLEFLHPDQPVLNDPGASDACSFCQPEPPLEKRFAAPPAREYTT